MSPPRVCDGPGRVNRKWIIDAFFGRRLSDVERATMYSGYGITWDDSIDSPPVFYVTAHRQLVEVALVRGWKQIPPKIAELVGT